jgi:putative ABC transport system ATP-binding protein
MAEAVISAVAVHKSFFTESGEVPVLRGVSFSVAPGEAVALRGVSGSGKSTLLNLLGAVDKVSQGSVCVCGQDLGSLTRRQQSAFRAQNVGYVFQFFNLMPTLTALENVAAALEANGAKGAVRLRGQALEALRDVGLADHADKFPSQLSGGEQQRVAIARAVVKRPPVILADEPTGNLDHSNARKIMELLRRVQGELKVAMVIATHDPLISEYVTRTYLLGDGVLEAPER